MVVFEKLGKWLLIAAVTCMLLVLAGYSTYIFLFESPVSVSKLDKLSVGMTTSQVKEILGLPNDDLGRVTYGGSGKFTHSWEFENFFHRKTAWVFFDNDDCYTHYKIEDGGI